MTSILGELRLGSFHNVVGGESKFFLQHFQRRRSSECLHSEDRSVNARVAAPSERGCLLHRHARLDSRGQHRSPVFFALSLKKLPGRHTHNACANPLPGQLLVGLYAQRQLATRRHEQYIRLAPFRVREYVGTLRESTRRSTALAVECG